MVTIILILLALIIFFYVINQKNKRSIKLTRLSINHTPLSENFDLIKVYKD